MRCSTFSMYASKQAMDGTLSLEAALDERLKIINCKVRMLKIYCQH